MRYPVAVVVVSAVVILQESGVCLFELQCVHVCKKNYLLKINVNCYISIIYFVSVGKCNY